MTINIQTFTVLLVGLFFVSPVSPSPLFFSLGGGGQGHLRLSSLLGSGINKILSGRAEHDPSESFVSFILYLMNQRKIY